MTTDLINDILVELKTKYGLNKTELERICDTEFKVLRLNIEQKNLKPVHLIHLGVVSPSKWFVEHRDEYVERRAIRLEKEKIERDARKEAFEQNKRDSTGVVQPINEQSEGEAVSRD